MFRSVLFSNHVVEPCCRCRAAGYTGIVGPRYCRTIERPSHYVGEVVHRFSVRDRAKGTAAFFMAMAIVYG